MSPPFALLFSFHFLILSVTRSKITQRFFWNVYMFTCACNTHSPSMRIGSKQSARIPCSCIFIFPRITELLKWQSIHECNGILVMTNVVLTSTSPLLCSHTQKHILNAYGTSLMHTIHGNSHKKILQHSCQSEDEHSIAECYKRQKKLLKTSDELQRRLSSNSPRYVEWM